MLSGEMFWHKDLPPISLDKIAVEHVLLEGQGSKMLSGHLKFQVKDDQSFLIHQTLLANHDVGKDYLNTLWLIVTLIII